MGKKTINSLLAQLKANQEREAVVDAMIFTTAQVAVNQLRERVDEQLRQIEGS